MAVTARILSIDGGGIRGIIPALVLQHLEGRTGARIADLFHMVAGTSTGGLLGAGLSVPGDGRIPKNTAADLAGLYRDRGEEIFDRSFWHGFGSLGGTVDEKYEARNLEDILEEQLGDAKLSDAIPDLLVTSYHIEDRKPTFFKSWKARGEFLRQGETAQDREFFLRDVVRATSAAPTYFEPALVENASGTKFPLVDGGVFANNPAMCALASARAIYPKATNFLIVSLGTGLTEREIPYKEAKDWGLIGWVRPLLNVIFDGVADAVDYQLDQELNQGRPKWHFRFQIRLDVRPEDPASPNPNDDFDDARPENILRLEARARELIQQERQALNRVVDRLRAPKDARANLIA
jgi:predicted acylesterase/phospholipase RssA